MQVPLQEYWMIVDLFCSCDLDLDPITTRIPWRYTGNANINFLIKAFESYCLTDRQTESTEIINHSA